MSDLVLDGVRCANHPNVETLVRCSRCETPICPKCMIPTPVGMRCRACANVRRAPVYDVRGRYLWQAIGAAVGLVLAGGFAFNLALGFAGRSILFAGLLYILTGIAAAELLSLAANRKRGRLLQGLAIVTVILMTQSGLLVALALAGRLQLNVISLVLTAIAAAIAWNRLR